MPIIKVDVYAQYIVWQGCRLQLVEDFREEAAPLAEDAALLITENRNKEGKDFIEAMLLFSTKDL